LTNSHPNAPEYVPPKAWWLCGLLFLATVLNYVDRQVLALTAEKVIAEFSLTKEAFGEVISAFRYSYGAVQIAGGWLVDRYGPRVVYPLAVGLWSLAGILTASATSVRMLSGFRFLLGVGEAFNWPRRPQSNPSASITARSTSGGRYFQQWRCSGINAGSGNRDSHFSFSRLESSFCCHGKSGQFVDRRLAMVHAKFIELSRRK
jgi:MFS family permease